MKQKNRYTEEQKRDAVRLSSEPGRKVEEVAKELGVGYSSLQKWRVEFGAANKKWETQSAEQQQIKKLQRDNERLQAENAFLKKQLDQPWLTRVIQVGSSRVKSLEIRVHHDIGER